MRTLFQVQYKSRLVPEWRTFDTFPTLLDAACVADFYTRLLGPLGQEYQVTALDVVDEEWLAYHEPLEDERSRAFTCECGAD